MLHFPTDTNHIANRVDVAEVAERVRQNGKRLRAMDARAEARRLYAAGSKAVALFFVCNEADDSISLRRMGPRGSCKIVWNYGSIRQ